jgi:hypothetical protein
MKGPLQADCFARHIFDHLQAIEPDFRWTRADVSVAACASQADASFRTAIRSPANRISATASRSLAAPSSQGADAVAPHPRLAAPAMRLAAFLRGSLHAALQDAST